MQVFKGMFKKLINEDYSISTDTDRYQSVLKHALSKSDFSVGTEIYMLPSNFNLNIRKTVGYSNKTLMRETNMKIGLNKYIKKDEVKKSPVTLPEFGRAQGTAYAAPKMHLMKSRNKPIKDHFVSQNEQTILLTDKRKLLAEKHNDEKLAITFLIVE